MESTARLHAVTSTILRQPASPYNEALRRERRTDQAGEVRLEHEDWNDPDLASTAATGCSRRSEAMAGWRSPTRGASIARSSPRRREVALGDAAIAVTAVSDSLASGELEEAQALARRIGIRHRVIRTEEFADPNYLRNNPDRCYFCKSELYGRLSGLLGELGVDVIASGANTDDRATTAPACGPPARTACGTRSRNAGWARPTSAPWPGPGTCPPGTSRRPPASPAGSPTART